MSVQATPDAANSCVSACTRLLTVLGEPDPALPLQQAFVEAARRTAARAGASGERLTTALFVILSAHAPEPAASSSGGLHLRCVSCRPDGLDPADQFPCPTAQQAFWALDAVLR